MCKLAQLTCTQDKKTRFELKFKVYGTQREAQVVPFGLP